jgi:hypothetical protein
MNTIKPGVYRHYKNKEYRVLCEAGHSETEERLVVYQCLYGDYSMWVRPKEMFLESVDVDGKSVPRFAFVSEAIDE